MEKKCSKDHHLKVSGAPYIFTVFSLKAYIHGSLLFFKRHIKLCSPQLLKSSMPWSTRRYPQYDVRLLILTQNFNFLILLPRKTIIRQLPIKSYVKNTRNFLQSPQRQWQKGFQQNEWQFNFFSICFPHLNPPTAGKKYISWLLP